MQRIPRHINTYCTYCKALGHMKEPAIWRISYDSSVRACEAHKEMLRAYEAERKRIDSHYSEADYQTWMKL